MKSTDAVKEIQQYAVLKRIESLVIGKFITASHCLVFQSLHSEGSASEPPTPPISVTSLSIFAPIKNGFISLSSNALNI
jgi:hypothetical protein